MQSISTATRHKIYETQTMSCCTSDPQCTICHSGKECFVNACIVYECVYIIMCSIRECMRVRRINSTVGNSGHVPTFNFQIIPIPNCRRSGHLHCPLCSVVSMRRCPAAVSEECVAECRRCVELVKRIPRSRCSNRDLKRSRHFTLRIRPWRSHFCSCRHLRIQWCQHRRIRKGNAEVNEAPKPSRLWLKRLKPVL